MSLTFTKLFSSITESTIWVAPDAHRLCWITMLAMADSMGRVWASVPGLANRARISIPATEQALKSFLAPDPYSRTKDHDGRRIEEIDGGWRLLNHSKYRAIRDEEAVKEAKRRYINTRRAVENVDRGRHNAEAEADSERTSKTSAASPAGLLASDNSETQVLIPLNSGPAFPVTKSMAAEFTKLYPAVDVPQTLNEIRAWSIANPTKRKTKTGAMRFINRWLAKEQNNG